MRRTKNAISHLNNVARGLLSERQPGGIRFHGGTSPLPVSHILVTPDIDHFVHGPDVGREPSDQIAKMTDLKAPSLRQRRCRDNPSHVRFDEIAAFVQYHFDVPTIRILFGRQIAIEQCRPCEIVRFRHFTVDCNFGSTFSASGSFFKKRHARQDKSIDARRLIRFQRFDDRIGDPTIAVPGPGRTSPIPAKRFGAISRSRRLAVSRRHASRSCAVDRWSRCWTRTAGSRNRSLIHSVVKPICMIPCLRIGIAHDDVQPNSATDGPAVVLGPSFT